MKRHGDSGRGRRPPRCGKSRRCSTRWATGRGAMRSGRRWVLRAKRAGGPCTFIGTEPRTELRHPSRSTPCASFSPVPGPLGAAVKPVTTTISRSPIGARREDTPRWVGVPATRGRGRRHPPSLRSTPAAATERQSRAEPPNRRGSSRGGGASPDFEAAAAALRGWETRYNYERFSLALQGRTPAEKLAALQPPRRAA